MKRGDDLAAPFSRQIFWTVVQLQQGEDAAAKLGVQFAQPLLGQGPRTEDENARLGAGAEHVLQDDARLDGFTETDLVG